MKKVIVVALLSGVAGLVQAQVPETKPGLWESKLTKNVVDGKDMTAQIDDAMAKMQARLAQMTPEQRAMVESHMKTMTSGSGGSVRFCVSPEMAAKHAIAGDPHGNCPPTSTSVSGNKTSFSINCTHDGRTAVGTGQIVVNGNSTTYHADMKTTDSKGSHTVVMDAEMRYLGSNCQGIKPLDQK